MINREIIYERNINASYMRIPAISGGNFDEKQMLEQKVEGLLPVERCYMNGKGEYWYNISGKQALDTYCRLKDIGSEFFENLILRICQQIEVLEWNLMDINCLMMDPELVFIGGMGEEISFMVYPDGQGDLFQEFQGLLEYLLTKINHKDSQAVGEAYKIYELVLTEEFTIGQLKKYILDQRMAQVKETDAVVMEPVKEWKEIPEEEEEVIPEKPLQTQLWEIVEEKLARLYEKAEEVLKRKKKEEILVVTPEEAIEEVDEKGEIHPTICLSASHGSPKGRLVCSQPGLYPQFQLENTGIVGKHPKAQYMIDKDTISQFHARIEESKGNYYIEDLNSTNGTYVNDKVLGYKQKYLLASGDSVRFADVLYQFY